MLRRNRASARPAPLPAADGLEPGGGRSVLIVSASMGAGHDGAARELARRLERKGHRAEVRDFLDAGPLRVGSALRSGYEFELRHVPSAYDATYRFWYKVPWLAPLLACFVTLLTHRRVLRWIRDADADAVVSTYPLATLCLGRLRATRRLSIPAVNFITDFGVHPLWVHKGMDLNLSVHAGPAEQASARTGRPGIACGPMVADRFDAPDLVDGTRRRQARADLGLGPEDLAVLIVAGSWGVGGLRETFEAVAATPGAVPVVVCGKDETLVTRVQEAADRLDTRAVVLGWTDKMPDLMAASDTLVENAGGLTAFEAMRIGLPVVSYRPIAGHGVENTAAMAAAGVSRTADDATALAEALAAVGRPGPERDAQVAVARSMFVSDAATGVLEAIPAVPAPVVRWSRRPRVVARRVAAALAVTAALTWGGLTTGVGVAAANGAGVAHPMGEAGPVVYVGVRLNRAEIDDPTASQRLVASGATAVLDDHTALADPVVVRRLADERVDIANGGAGRWMTSGGHPVNPTLWTRARGDVDAANVLTTLVGRPVTVFAPGRRVNAFDMVDASRAHDRLVVPNSEVGVDDEGGCGLPSTIHAHSILLLNGMEATPAQLTGCLASLLDRLKASGLTVSQFSQLH